MYGEDFRVLVDSSDDNFNQIDTEEFISVLSNLEEVSEYKDPMTVYDFFQVNQ